MKKILIVSTQRPYYGGAATNAYALIKYFRSNGYDAAGLFYDNTKKSIDPDGIGGVFRYRRDATSRFQIRKSLGGDPDIIFAKNYAAPSMVKGVFPKPTLVYLVSGSPQMMDISARGSSARRYLASKRSVSHTAEKSAVDVSDYVMPNSSIGRELLVKHYGDLDKITNPVNTSLARNSERRGIAFKDRKYDVAFICSNMGRSVKNAKLAKSIFSKLRIEKKIAIGLSHSMFGGIINTEHYGLLGNDKIMRILCDTKLVICTSYYDASPNIISEALSCGSNILISKNCGWSEIYPSKFVCEDVYDQKEWIDKARALIGANVRFSSSGEAGDVISGIKEVLCD
jgi:glycosyltransferase involved in cell wall biosynthesis